MAGEMTAGEAALAVCGLGPAGSGLLVAAAREGRLDQLLDGGVVAVDPRGPADLAGGLGRYRITANSLGKVFLECLDGPAGDTLLAGLAGSPEAAALRAYAEDYPPLPVIGPFVARVAERVAGALAAHPACRLLTGVGADAVDVGPDGLTVRDSARGRHRVRSAVLTLGGAELADTRDGLLRAAAGAGLVGRVLPGHAVISDPRTVAAEPEVTVLGGSHSGWAVAARLVAAGGRVTLVQRRPPPTSTRRRPRRPPTATPSTRCGTSARSAAGCTASAGCADRPGTWRCGRCGPGTRGSGWSPRPAGGRRPRWPASACCRPGCWSPASATARGCRR